MIRTLSRSTSTVSPRMSLASSSRLTTLSSLSSFSFFSSSPSRAFFSTSLRVPYPLSSLSPSFVNVPVRYMSYPSHVVLPMPALSPTMEKGNIASWKVKVGDKVTPGSVLAEVETDKATVAFEAVEEGYVAKILVPAGGGEILVNTPVAVIAENKEDVGAFENFSAGGGQAKEAPKQATQAPAQATQAPAAPAPPASTASSSSSSDRVIASPAAKRVSRESNVDLKGLAGTGPGDRILVADVMDAMASGNISKTSSTSSASMSSSLPSPPLSASGDFRDIPHTNMRKVIASRLLQAKTTIPHYYLSIECCVDNLLKIRSELNSKLEKDAKLSVNDFIIKASALACRKVPQVNSSWTDSHVRQYNYVDVSVAVSTDAGLVTPIVKDSDIKGLSAIGSDVKSLAAKARSGKLQPHEYQGGTFTISNLGMFGVKTFSAIINPPQAAILAVGTSESRVVQTPEGGFSSAQFMSVTLSCDHRVIDGAVGAQWLKVFKEYIENPVSMIL